MVTRQKEKSLKDAAWALWDDERAFAAAGGKGLSPMYQKNLEFLGDCAVAWARRHEPVVEQEVPRGD